MIRKPFGLFLEVPPDQAYYWTEEWQQAEREAEAEIAAGNCERYESAEAFLASLDGSAALVAAIAEAEELAAFKRMRGEKR